ncbi:MAG TPA: hypothetical protein VFO67_14405, partial [Gemmatimonadales bacterium]|nr:hypothetical protein [Gemmatimonadales bacterium]
MSEIRSALHRLCEHVGITDGYRDVWGRDHRTTDETRLALLKAMSVIDEVADAEAALRAREEREWRSRLPPVVVRGEQTLPLRWHVCIEESAAYQSLPWTITLESGEALSGEIRPADFEGVTRRAIDGAGWVKVAFQLRHRLPTGYHRFHVRFPGAVERSMTLIVVPSR